MKLNENMEKFYQSFVKYIGATLEKDGSITNVMGQPMKNKKDKIYHLPYFELLKNPEGKAFIHVLHENYKNPMSDTFTIVKNNLVLDINAKLTAMFHILLSVCSDPNLQNDVVSSTLLDILATVGSDVDSQTVENLKKLQEAGEGKRDLAYFLNLYVKPNGKLGEKNYEAIGKVNFTMYKELKESLEEKTARGYEVYGTVFRKKDIVAYTKLFEAVFPGLDDEANYSEGSNNQIFRCLDVLIRTAYIITNRMNEILNAISFEIGNESVLKMVADHEWVEVLPKLYEMAVEIRSIPNQDDIQIEADLAAGGDGRGRGHAAPPSKLVIDDSRAANVNVQEQAPAFTPQGTVDTRSAPPAFNPGMASPRHEPAPTHVSSGPSMEDILRGNVPQPTPAPQPQAFRGPAHPAPQYAVVYDAYNNPYYEDQYGNVYAPDGTLVQPAQPTQPAYGAAPVHGGYPVPQSPGQAMPEWLQKETFENNLRRQGIDPQLYYEEQARIAAQSSQAPAYLTRNLASHAPMHQSHSYHQPHDPFASVEGAAPRGSWSGFR